MRVKPAPGAYTATVDGSTFTVVITPDGATSGFYWRGQMVEMEWEWFELPPDGPALMPSGGLAVQFVGLNDDGSVDVVFPDGAMKTGTYAPV